MRLNLGSRPRGRSGLRTPGFGWCLRCQTSWDRVAPHSTTVGNEGAFPLCELCWRGLTPERRLPFYQVLVEQWRRVDSPPDSDWEAALYLAVLAGQ